MISMLNRAWKSLEIDTTKALKNNFILNSFDGSEDHLVSDKLFGLVGAEMLEFREALLKSQLPSSLQELINSITPPKGVKTKQITVGAVPPDEGTELLDCDGDEIEHEADVLPEPEIDEDGVDNTEEVASNQAATSDSVSVSTQMSSEMEAPLSSLVGLDESLKADCLFLEDLKAVMQRHSTSVLFMPYMCQFRSTHAKARASLKKRIQTDSSLVQQLAGNSKPKATNATQPKENSHGGDQHMGTEASSEVVPPSISL